MGFSCIESLRLEINERLMRVFPDSDEPFLREVLQAHSYPLASGGKRVRPLIVLLVAGSFAGERGVAMAWPGALALELVHSYSLVHDDLPCMDNDDLRRGRPTVHKVYGEAKGLLVGDGLLTRAFALLAEQFSNLSNEESHDCVPDAVETLLRLLSIETLAHAAGEQGMIAGQWMDVSVSHDLRENPAATLELLETLKTGRLLSAAFELGVLAGLAARGSGPEALGSSKAGHVRVLARECGETLGVAFQICDDLLDTTAPSSLLGKSPGKDAAQKKLTAVSVYGAGRAADSAREWTDRSMRSLEKLLSHGARVEAPSREFAADLSELCRQLLFRKV